MFPGSRLPINMWGAQGKSTWRPIDHMSKYLKVMNPANKLLYKICSLILLDCSTYIMTARPSLNSEFSHSLEFQTRTSGPRRVVPGPQCTFILFLFPAPSQSVRDHSQVHVVTPAHTSKL